MDDEVCIPTITCACGFKVSGNDEEANVRAFNDHPCPNNPPAPDHWYDAVFSLPGVAIIFIICLTLSEILTK